MLSQLSNLFTQALRVGIYVLAWKHRLEVAPALGLQIAAVAIAIV